MKNLRILVAAFFAVLLAGCNSEPRVMYFVADDGDATATGFAVCGGAIPGGDSVTDFTSDGYKYRMLWAKGTMCERGANGAFGASYTLHTGNNATATHVYVDRSGVLMDHMEFGLKGRISTAARSTLASNIDAIALGLLGGLALAIFASFLRKRRGPTAAQSGNHPNGTQIILEEHNFPATDVVRALGAGAVLSCANGYPMNVMDPRQAQNDMKWLLDESWHVFGAEDLENAFQHLLRYGHSEVLDWMIEESLAVPEAQLRTRLIEEFQQDRDATELSEFAANFGPAVEWMREAGFIETDADLLRGTSAFDIDRAVWLVRTGLGAGYLSRRTALDMVMHAGDHARARFGSWREYGTSVLLGRAIWGGVDDKPGLFAERAAIVETLMTDPRSTWVTAGWWPAVEEESTNGDPDEGEGEAQGPDIPVSGPTVH